VKAQKRKGRLQLRSLAVLARGSIQKFNV